MFTKIKQSVIATLMKKFRSLQIRAAHDIYVELQKRALQSTAEFVEEHLLNVRTFQDKYELLKFSLENTDENGLFLEFGVFQGNSINFIANHTSSVVHGFDSFEGLPESWRPGYGEGKFSLGGTLPRVKENVELHKGWFDDTLPVFCNKNPQKVSFLHIDCDLYSSTKTIFDALDKQVDSGTVIVFDEYFNHPGWLDNEYKAFQEYIEGRGLEYKYIGYNQFSEQVAVKLI